MSPPFALYTIGYGGVEWPAFLSALKNARVQIVVDCRLVPQSKTKADYSSEHLGCALGAMKIDYVWAQELGHSEREACRAALSSPGYRQYLQEDPEVLRRLIGLLRGGVQVALLCGCVRHQECRRWVIAQEVQRRLPGLEFRHLHPPLATKRHKPSLDTPIEVPPPPRETPRSEAPPLDTPREQKIYGLTLKQPWPWAIVAKGKRIENRTWVPLCPLGTLLAIHAGQGHDAVGAAWMAGWGIRVPAPQDLPRGIVAVARLDQIVVNSSDLWFRGPYGWVLGEVVPIEPVPCCGRLGLWPLPPDKVDQVRRLYAAGRAV